MKDFGKLHVEDYLSMFWRRKWHALLAALVVASAGVFVAYHLPAIYKSETTILVQNQGISEGYVKPADSAKLEDRLALISQELQSRSLLEPVIRDLRLFGYGGRAEFSMDDAVSRMRQNVEVRLGSANAFTVAYYSGSPTLARDVTRRLAENMIQSRTSSREEQAVVTDQFLDDQLRQAEKDLAIQEARLKVFKTQNLGALPEQNAANLAGLNGLHSQLISNESAIQRAQDQQLILEQRLTDVRRMNSFSREVISKVEGKEGASGAVPLSSRAGLLAKLDTKRKELADLSLKYTDKFPDVLRLKREIQDLQQQLNQLPAPEEGENDNSKGVANPSPAPGAEGDISAITSQLAILKRDLTSHQKEHEDILRQIRIYQDRLNLSPRVEQELLSITRDYESMKEHYKSLQDKKFNARVAANLEKSKINEVFKVIDEAYLPERPVKPDRRRIALLGVFAGICCGLGLVVVVEYFDPTLGDEDIASTELKLPVLVSIPEIREGERMMDRSSDRNARWAKRA